MAGIDHITFCNALPFGVLAAKRPHMDGAGGGGSTESELRDQVAQLKSQLSVLLQSTAALAGAIGQGGGLPAAPPPAPHHDTSIAAMRE